MSTTLVVVPLRARRGVCLCPAEMAPQALGHGDAPPGSLCVEPDVAGALMRAAREDPDRVFVVSREPGDLERARDVEASFPVVPVGLVDAGDPTRLERAGAWFLAADADEAALLVSCPRMPLSVSLILVAFNEEECIGPAVLDAHRFGETYLANYEVVVVDDGSADATAERAIAAGDVRLVRHPVNRGMGAAIRSGYEAARLAYVAHFPADRQVRPQALVGMLPHVGEDRVVLSQYHHPPSGAARAQLSSVFRLIMRHLGGLEVDFAGTYVFHRRWLGLLHDGRTASDTFLFTFEWLQCLADAGCAVTEVTIHNFPRQTGQSRVLNAGRVARVFGEILEHRLRTLRLRAGWGS